MAVLFKFLDGEYSYPQGLGDVPFSQFFNYIEKVLPRKPVVLQNLEQCYVEEGEVNARLVKLNLSRDRGPERTEQLAEANREMEEVKRKRVELTGQITDKVYAHILLPYFAEVVAFFCLIPYDLLIGKSDPEGRGMVPNEIEALYWMIVSSLEIKEEDYRYRKRFEFKGMLYELPDRFMERGTVIEFMEAAQLQSAMVSVQNGYFHSMLDVAAVLLKRPGERYSDAVYERNKRDFKMLPTSVIVQVSFFLLKRNEGSKKNSRTFTDRLRWLRLKLGWKN